jgi:hypothetical protein
MKVVVYHGYYGCDTGCCGHVVTVDGKHEKFEFDHPWDEDHKEFAVELARSVLGRDVHFEDLDWDECLILDD